MKLMSFALTSAQVRARTKTVTRRTGWLKAKHGDVYLAIEKARGVPVKKRVVLGKIRVKSVRRERLNLICQYGWANQEVFAEGFPDLSPEEFVEMFCRHMRCKPNQIVTRIAFEYL